MKIEIIPARQPLNKLIKIASRCLIKICTCLYNGTAKQTVAGVNKKVINWAPLLYVSKSISKKTNTPIEMMALINKGLKIGYGNNFLIWTAIQYDNKLITIPK